MRELHMCVRARAPAGDETGLELGEAEVRDALGLLERESFVRLTRNVVTIV